jgi:hypothetical protein
MAGLERYYIQLESLHRQLDALFADYPHHSRLQPISNSCQTFNPTEDASTQTEFIRENKSLVDELREARMRLFSREA